MTFTNVIYIETIFEMASNNQLMITSEKSAICDESA